MEVKIFEWIGGALSQKRNEKRDPQRIEEVSKNLGIPVKFRDCFREALQEIYERKMVRKKLAPEDLKDWEGCVKGKKPKEAPKVSLSQLKKGESKTSPPKSKPNPTTMHRKEVKSIKIQATLDLQGLSLTQGRDAFESFVQQRMSRGYKYLLVITGKGAVSFTLALFSLEEKRIDLLHYL